MGVKLRPPLLGLSPTYSQQEKADHELMSPHRLLYWSERIENEDEFGEDAENYMAETPKMRIQVEGAEANLISSLTTSGLHAPVLDLDFKARLIPSRTPGHHHLYLDKEMPWWKYRFMLWALKICGVIEPGYYRASVHRRMTFCRWRIWSHFEVEDQQEMMKANIVGLRERLRQQ